MADQDCPTEAEHLWECCREFDICLWCEARVACRHR